MPASDQASGRPLLTRAHEYFRHGPANAEGWSMLIDRHRKSEAFYRERWSHVKVVRSTHGVNCTGSCSWNVYVKDGLITWKTLATDYPRTDPGRPDHEPRGCPRGASFSWYTYSPARLKYPLVRGSLLERWRAARAAGTDPVTAWAQLADDGSHKGERGRCGFVRATWEEATELVAAATVHTIKAHGPDRVTVLGRLVIRESRDERCDRSLDIAGLLASGVGLFTLVFTLVESGDRGWGSPAIMACLGVSVGALTLFALIETRRSAPMLDIALFKQPTFAGADVVGLLLMFSIYGVFFFLSLYMQTVLGWSAVKTGAAFLPMTALIMIVAPAAGKLSDRYGPRGLMTGSMLLMVAASTLFAQLDTRSGFWQLLPGLLLAEVALAAAMSPAINAVLSPNWTPGRVVQRTVGPPAVPALRSAVADAMN